MQNQNIRTIVLPATMYILKPANLPMRTTDHELGVYIDGNTNETLGLLFSSEQAAKLFMYLHAVKDQHIKPISKDEVVMMARRLIKTEAVHWFVMDLGAIGTPCTQIPLPEVGKLPINQDRRYTKDDILLFFSPFVTH